MSQDAESRRGRDVAWANRSFTLNHLATAVLALLLLTTAAPADYLSERKAAVALAESNQHGEALAAFLALADLPDASAIQKTDALRLAVSTACRLERYEQAAQLAQRIPLEAYRKAAQIEVLEAQRQWEAIIDRFGREPIEAWASAVSGRAFMARGRAYSALKKGKQAEKDFSRAVALISQTFPLAEACNERGDNLLNNLGNRDQALASYRKNVEVMTGSGSYLYYNGVIAVADILREQRKFDAAAQTLGEIDARKLGGYWAGRILAARAKGHLAQGQREQAIARYQEAVALPDLPDHLNRELQQALDALQTPAKP